MVIFLSHVNLPEGTQYEHVPTLGTSWYSVVHRVDGATDQDEATLSVKAWPFKMEKPGK